jgi:hypothetical protein
VPFKGVGKAIKIVVVKQVAMVQQSIKRIEFIRSFTVLAVVRADNFATQATSYEWRLLMRQPPGPDAYASHRARNKR